MGLAKGSRREGPKEKTDQLKEKAIGDQRKRGEHWRPVRTGEDSANREEMDQKRRLLVTQEGQRLIDESKDQKRRWGQQKKGREDNRRPTKKKGLGKGEKRVYAKKTKQKLNWEWRRLPAGGGRHEQAAPTGSVPQKLLAATSPYWFIKPLWL